MTELKARRLAHGLTQADTADRIGLSRQGYAAIEAGRARPSVDVALRLATLLAASVEGLFGAPARGRRSRSAELVGTPPSWPAPVRVAEMAGRTLAFPTGGAFGEDIGLAQGLATPHGRGVRVAFFDRAPAPVHLVVMGCDPAFAIVAERLRRERGIESLWIPTGSRRALDGLARGEAHVAGVHLGDNAAWAARVVPGADLVHFARWEQTLLLASDNPFGIEAAEDLARPGVRLVNREPGSGSRALLDHCLADAGIAGRDVTGYADTHARGHLEVASAVAAGTADAGVAIRAAGHRFGLRSILLRDEPYDLVIPRASADLPAVRALIDLLGDPGLRRRIEALGGYDASRMGRPA